MKWLENRLQDLQCKNDRFSSDVDQERKKKERIRLHAEKQLARQLGYSRREIVLSSLYGVPCMCCYRVYSVE